MVDLVWSDDIEGSDVKEICCCCLLLVGDGDGGGDADDWVGDIIMDPKVVSESSW